MKLRYFFIILIVGSLFLLSIAGGGLYWILAQSPWNILRGGITTYPEAAIFVPKNAPAMVSLGINPDRLEAWRLLATPIGDRQESRRELNEIEYASLPGFDCLPLSQFSQWEKQINTRFDRDVETIVMCHHGVRSAQMCQWLLNIGFTKVKNVSGGIDAYSVVVDPSLPRY